MPRYDYDDDYGDYLYEQARDRRLDEEWMEHQWGQALVAEGWSAVPVVDESDVNYDWLRKNAQGETKVLNRHVYFQNRNDAVLFEITWCHNEKV